MARKPAVRVVPGMAHVNPAPDAAVPAVPSGSFGTCTVGYDPEPAIEVKEKAWPADWVKGQLLNVRKAGDKYCVTLLGEEFDPRQPERALHFENSYDANAFIGWWYGRDGAYPL